MFQARLLGGSSNFSSFQSWKRLSLIGNSRFYSNNAPSAYEFETLSVSVPSDYVYHVEINRPKKLNTMNKAFWREIKACFDSLGEDSSCRAIVLSGKGKLFTAGIDLTDLAEMGSIVTQDIDVARKCRLLKKTINEYQASFSSLEKCPKPVIAAVHSACIGGGIDLICSADIRYCSNDAWFQVQEVNVGLAADVGTLQRLPKIVGNESLVRELCFTGRKFYSDEAKTFGLVSRILPDRKTLIERSLELAKTIAEKSPVAVQTTKDVLIYSRDNTVDDCLEYNATLNMTFLQSEDVMKAAMAIINKEDRPEFSKL